MTLWSSKEVEKITGGYSTREWSARGVAIDSALVKPGDLFIHTPGASVQDIVHAFERGATAAAVTLWPEGLAQKHALLIVDDPRKILHILAHAALKRCGAKRVMITGSSKRSGMFEMMEAAFKTFAYTHAVSIQAAKADEMALALACLNPGTDILLLDKDEDFPCNYAPDIIVRPCENISALEDVKILASLEAENGTRLRALVKGEEITLTVPQAGRQVLLNVLSVLSVLVSIGGNLQRGAMALQRSLEPEEFAQCGNNIRLIEDVTHVSCAPARKAFKVLALVDPGRGKRKLALLSHLNNGAAQKGGEHDISLSLPLRSADVQFLYTRAPSNIAKERDKAHKEPQKFSLKKIVPDVLAPGDVLMFKERRGHKKQIEMKTLRLLSHLSTVGENLYTNAPELSNDVFFK